MLKGLLCFIIMALTTSSSAYGMQKTASPTKKQESALTNIDYRSCKIFKETLFDVIEKTRLFSLFYWHCFEYDPSDLRHNVLVKTTQEKQQPIYNKLLEDLEFLLKIEVDNPYLSTKIRRDEFTFFNDMVASTVETAHSQAGDASFKRRLRKNFSNASLTFYRQLRLRLDTLSLTEGYQSLIKNIVCTFELIFAELDIDPRSIP